MQAPTLAGVELRRPNRYSRKPVALASPVELASGAISTYHRGHRTVVELRWSNLRSVDAEVIDSVARVVGPVAYVDIDGSTYIMIVPAGGYGGLEAVPGTYPVRYDTSLTLQERAPR